MSDPRKQWIHDLLKKGIEKGDADAVKVVDESKYVQHNPMTKEGGIGLAELFANLAKTDPRVDVIRLFSDGDYVFAHTEYNFSSVKICFEVFRFEGDKAVEHWDNLQLKQPNNPSGHSMVDGETSIADLDKTEANRSKVVQFVTDIVINQHLDDLPLFFFAERYTEHNPDLNDDVDMLADALAETFNDGAPCIHYQKLHHVFAEGNFVLTVCEGNKRGTHVAFYDLFRLENDLIVEHWDTVEAIPPKETWNNQNGKF